MPTLHPRLQALADDAAARASVAMRPATLATFVQSALVGLAGAAELARRGHLGWASVAGLAPLAVTVVAALAQRFAPKQKRLFRAVSRQEPELARKMFRAGSLAQSTGEAEPIEKELAELHLTRQVALVRWEPAERLWDRRATWIAGLSLGLCLSVAVVTARDPLRLLEGLDVLASKGAVAPLPVLYLDDVELEATTPRYLGSETTALRSFGRYAFPRGTEFVLRGRPTVKGREVALRIGDEPLVLADDGRGQLVGRWTLEGPADVRVGVLFGGIWIQQADVLTLEAIADDAPKVTLVGAPKTVRLVETPTLGLEYAVEDDHGIAEIALVFRSGPKEERRTLSRPAVGAKKEQGGTSIDLSMELFFRKTLVPVEITVSAKDNDPITGPKWGNSQAIVVIPPIVGEPEAKKMAELRRVRDGAVDLLARRVITEKTSPFSLPDERTAHDEFVALAEGALAPLRGKAVRAIRGQIRRLSDAQVKFERSKSQKAYAELEATTEAVVLAIDATLEAEATSDSRKVAKRLAEVAEEASIAAELVGHPGAAPEERARGHHRLGAAMNALGAGAQELSRLGALGADLGDLSVGALRRAQREIAATDWVGAELVLRDLVLRLKMPVFSVGGGGTPGVESGGGDGSTSAEPEGEDGEETSEANEEGRGQAKELDDLISRHQRELDRVESALRNATTPEERAALEKLAKEEASALREALADLPSQAFPGTAGEKAAQAKRRGEAVASALERGKLSEAIQEGRGALEALGEAKRQADEEGDPVSEALGGATSALRGTLERLGASMDEVEERAKERSKSELDEVGKSEGRLGDRTRALKERGADGDGAMPEDVTDALERAEKAMREAEKALSEGDVDRGREKQREAQRLLEMSKADDASEEPDGERDGDGSLAEEAPVPKKSEHRGPEAWRERVLDGLGKPGEARIREAIRRYAEGLVQ